MCFHCSCFTECSSFAHLALVATDTLTVSKALSINLGRVEGFINVVESPFFFFFIVVLSYRVADEIEQLESPRVALSSQRRPPATPDHHPPSISIRSKAEILPLIGRM